MEKYHNIPIVLITDDNYMLQTGVTIWSLIKGKKATTKYNIYIILADCKKDAKKFFDRLLVAGIEIHYIKRDLKIYSSINQLAHISRACLLKFEIAELIKDYDKVLYLDGDLHIRGDLSELYCVDLEGNVIGAVKSLDMLFDKKEMISAGVMLIDTKVFREENYAHKLLKTRISLGDQRSMDQQTINIVLEGKIKYLSTRYNCIPEKLLGEEKKSYIIQELNDLYETSYSSKRQMVDDAVIIHYATAGKPWRFTFVPCADEWYDCYQSSPYSGIRIKRRNRVQALIHGGIETLKQNGIKGVIKRILQLVGLHLKKQEYKKWG